MFGLDPKAKLTDLYAGRNIPIRGEQVELRPGVSYKTGVIRLTLKHGQGILLEQRQQWRPPLPINYPASLKNVPAEKIIWLIDIKPQKTILCLDGCSPNKDTWKRKTWKEVNGVITLYTDLNNPLGIMCPKSLYAQAETTIVYNLPPGCSKFVAAAGLGTRHIQSSVVFKIIVDGKEKFRSGIYRIGDPIIPVVVDIEGAKQLKLVTTHRGNWIGQDYAWWGDARLIKNQACTSRQGIFREFPRVTLTGRGPRHRKCTRT